MQDVELSRDLNKPNRRYYFKPGFVFFVFFSKPTGADVDKRKINFELGKVTR